MKFLILDKNAQTLFNKHYTLLEQLLATEQALNSATTVSVSVERTGDNSYAITFADASGETITTNTFELPAGKDGNGIVETETIDSREDNGYTLNTVQAMLENGEDVVFTVKVKNGERGERGERGAQGDQGLPGVQGIQGIQGPPGPQGIQGIQGPPGPQGPQGLAGENGRSFQITTVVPTADALPPAGAVYIGKAYGVGTEKAYEVYICVEESGVIKWVNWGTIQGPQGPQGLQGEQGVQGPQGLQGEQGVQGPQGLQGNAGARGASISVINNIGDRDYGGYTISTLQPIDSDGHNLPTVEIRAKNGAQSVAEQPLQITFVIEDGDTGALSYFQLYNVPKKWSFLKTNGGTVDMGDVCSIMQEIGVTLVPATGYRNSTSSQKNTTNAIKYVSSSQLAYAVGEVAQGSTPPFRIVNIPTNSVIYAY